MCINSRVKRRLVAIIVLCFIVMDYDKFKQLMEEILQSRKKTRQKLEGKITDLNGEVTVAQEKTLQELAQRVTKSSYQLQRKGHKRQFNFNFGVQQSIVNAQGELIKVTPTGEKGKEVLKKVSVALDEGAKALATRQKHVQLADRFEFGWVCSDGPSLHAVLLCASMCRWSQLTRLVGSIGNAGDYNAGILLAPGYPAFLSSEVNKGASRRWMS